MKKKYLLGSLLLCFGVGLSLTSQGAYAEEQKYGTGAEIHDAVEVEQPEIAIRSGRASLPQKFDPKMSGNDTPVKNQLDVEICWAFASTGILETAALRQLGVEYDFSEQYLDNYLGHNANGIPYANLHSYGREIRTAGNEVQALYGAFDWSNPVLEETMPFLRGNNNPFISLNQLEEEPSVHVQGLAILPKLEKDYSEQDRLAKVEQVKKQVMNNSGVSYGFLTCYFNNEESGTNYFNGSTFAYHVPRTGNNIEADNSTPGAGEHLSMIIGWDDNYSKENFGTKPKNNGAFIVRNSWGNRWGDGGYFYVSYEDYYVARHEMFSVSQIENKDNYDNQYSHTEFYGKTMVPFSTSYADTFALANVFKTSDEKESLEAVAIHTMQYDTSYEIYVNPNGTQISDLKSLVKVAEGVKDVPGFETIKLAEDVELSANSEFTVVVRYKASENVNHTAFLTEKQGTYMNIAVNAEESYACFGGATENMDFFDVKDEYNSNVYINAYTDTVKSVPVTGVSINPTSKTLSVGSTQQLTATVSPSNATNKLVTWSSSNTSVATVDANGKVTAKAGGTATVTAKTADGNKTAASTITVTVPVTGVNVNPTSKTLTVGDTQQLTATVTPSNATNKNMTWSSSNTNVATVSASGLVTAKTAGTAAITVKTADGSKTATSTITVSAPAAVSVTGVSVSPASRTLTMGGTQQLTATVSPSNATNKNVTWSSSNTSVATVSTSGLVTAKAGGAATITVKTADGSKTATSTITVSIPVTGVSLSPVSKTLKVSETQQLTATVSPSNAANKSVTWSSSNSSVATVSASGLVTAKTAGTAKITVKTADGSKTATSTITVVEESDGVYGTVPWIWDDPTQTLVFLGGEFPTTSNGTKTIQTVIEADSHLNGKKIKKIVFQKEVVANEESRGLFSYLSSLEEIVALEKLDVSNVKIMSMMFARSPKIVKLDLSSFDTSQVTEMRGVFSYTSSLKELNLEGLNTSNVTDMYCLFDNASSLKKLDLSSFDTRKVTNMSSLFNWMNSLTDLNISSFDTSNVTQMFNMFYGTSSLDTLNLNHFNTSKVTSMSNMFGYMEGLSELRIDNFDTSKVIDMRGMFCGIPLTELDLSHLDTKNVVYMSSMFARLTSLKSLDLSTFNTENVVDMSSMFSQSSLESINLSSFNTGKVLNMRSMFYGASALKKIDLSQFDTKSVTNMASMFFGASSIEELNLVNFNTSKVTDMSCMFSGARSLRKLNIDNFDTSSVTDMSAMFGATAKLESIDVSGFDTSNVKNMSSMYSRTGLKQIDLGNFNTSKVTNMSYMFSLASNLTTVNLESFDTSKVTIMYNMFENAASLETLDISSFDTRNANVDSMFVSASSLEELKLGVNFRFNRHSALVGTVDTIYTGRWVGPKESGASVVSYPTNTLFMGLYNGSVPGTYVREKK